jgi:hypothetical protein
MLASLAFALGYLMDAPSALGEHVIARLRRFSVSSLAHPPRLRRFSVSCVAHHPRPRISNACAPEAAYLFFMPWSMMLCISNAFGIPRSVPGPRPNGPPSVFAANVMLSPCAYAYASVGFMSAVIAFTASCDALGKFCVALLNPFGTSAPRL